MEFVLGLVVAGVTGLDIEVAYSEYTPAEEHGNVYIQNSNDIELLISNRPDIVLDNTYSITWSSLIAKGARENQFLHFVSRRPGFVTGSHTYSLKPSEEDEFSAIELFLRSIGVHRYKVIYHVDLYSEYSLIISRSSNTLPLSDDISLETLQNHLKSTVKYTPENNVIIIAHGEFAQRILKAGDLSEMTESYKWILFPEADYLKYSNGSNLEENGVLRISTAYSTLESTMNTLMKVSERCSETYTPCTLLMMNLTGTHYINPQYEIMNTQNSTYVPIGTVSLTSVDLYGDIVWPGGGTPASKKVLTISRDSALRSPQDEYLEFLLPAYQGAALALSYINSNDRFLRDYELRVNNFNFGGTYFDYDFALREYTNKASELKTILLAPAMSDVTMGVIPLLEEHNVHIPMIGYSNTAPALSSTGDFAHYIRVCPSDNYQTVLLLSILEVFHWEKVGVLYLNNVFSRSLYGDFVKEIEGSDIEILNEEQNILPDNSADWENSEIDPVLHYLEEVSSRVIIIFCYTSDIRKILLRMHELGYHNNNYEYLAVGWLVDELINENKISSSYNSTRENIMREALRGSLMLFPASFTGEFGDEIYSLYNDTYITDPVGYTAFAFDAVLAAAHALDYLSLKGEDYTDSSLMMSTLRDVKFTGATGRVSINTLNNDRYAMDHAILNTQKLENGE